MPSIVHLDKFHETWILLVPPHQYVQVAFCYLSKQHQMHVERSAAAMVLKTSFSLFCKNHLATLGYFFNCSDKILNKFSFIFCYTKKIIPLLGKESGCRYTSSNSLALLSLVEAFKLFRMC